MTKSGNGEKIVSELIDFNKDQRGGENESNGEQSAAVYRFVSAAAGAVKCGIMAR